jgi:trehalose 6-phosphate synthase
MSFTWIGWPGKDVSHTCNNKSDTARVKPSSQLLILLQIPEQDRDHVNRRLLEEHQCYPVYLSDELADRHYNGMRS